LQVKIERAAGRLAGSEFGRERRLGAVETASLIDESVPSFWGKARDLEGDRGYRAVPKWEAWDSNLLLHTALCF
jgi:hypothetical protein